MLPIYICFLVVISQLFTSIGTIDPGTVIQVGNNSINTGMMIHKFKEFMSENDGRQLRIKVNGGCVDAGHHSQDRRAGGLVLTPYINEDCGVHPWTKWFWDEDYLKVGWTSDDPDTYGCLGFWDEGKAPDLNVYACVDISPFIIRFHPNQFDFARQELYFSIHSKVHPNKCLGMYNKGLELHHNTRGSQNKTIRRDVFQLQECHGLDHQSFFLESKQFDIVDSIKQKIFGPEEILPWSKAKNSNCTLVNRIDVN